MNAITTWHLDCGANVSFEITPELQQQLHSHPHVIEHLLKIGLKNVVQDSHASVVRKDFKTDDDWIAAKRERASLKLGKLLAGELRAQKAERQPKLDDYVKFARSWLLAKIKPAFIAKNGKAAWKEKTEGDSGAEFIQQLVFKNAEKFQAEIIEAYRIELAAREKEAALADSMDLDI